MVVHQVIVLISSNNLKSGNLQFLQPSFWGDE